MNKTKIKDYVLLHSILLLYSLAGVFSKLAALHAFLSLPFLFFYGVGLLILMIYAVIWQQVLKRMSMTAAFANKAIVIVWGLLWGRLIFLERINAQMIVGAILITVGIVYVVKCDG